MPVVGVDGCKAGWFAVRLESDGNHAFNVFPTISDLWDEWGDASRILIDIPIGLSDSNRQCGTDARREIGCRHSTVFTPPCREALRPSAY